MTDLDLGDVIGKIRPHTRTVSICLDGELENERVHLEDKLAQARDEDARAESADYQPKAAVIAEQIQALQEQAKDVTVDFTFRSIGRRSWSTMVSMHPATEEQIQAARDLEREPLDYNIDTFPRAVMVKSLTAPNGVTEERLEELEKSLSEGQWRRLWQCCLVANLGVGDVGESLAASAVLASSARKSKRQPESELQDPSS